MTTQRATRSTGPLAASAAVLIAAVYGLASGLPTASAQVAPPAGAEAGHRLAAPTWSDTTDNFASTGGGTTGGAAGQTVTVSTYSDLVNTRVPARPTPSGSPEPSRPPPTVTKSR